MAWRSLGAFFLLVTASGVWGKTWSNVKFAVTMFNDWDHRTTPEPPIQERVTVTQTGPSGSRMALTFRGLGKSWNLNLQRNNIILGNEFSVDYIGSDGRIRRSERLPTDCFFIGTASAGPNEVGYASVTTCYDKLQAYIITNHDDYALNPYISSQLVGRKRRQAPTLHHYRREGQNGTRSKRYPRVDLNFAANEWLDVHFQPLHQPPGRTLNIEVGVVVEQSYRRAFEREISRKASDLHLQIAKLIQNSQLWYIHPTLGYRFWLTLRKIVISEEAWEPPNSGSFTRSLNGVCTWHAANIADSRNWDAAVLLSDDLTYFDGGAGLGQVRGMCHPKGQHCVGIGKCNFHTSELTRTISHEIGHLLDMADAYYKPMELLCYTGMMRMGVYEDHDWDTCGVQRMENFIHVREKTCLRNTPSLSRRQVPPRIPGNVAWRASAKQSSTYHNERMWGAWKATDGALSGVPPKDTNATLASCTQTVEENNPWIMVDLSSRYASTPIYEIHIYNREDCCEDWLSNFEVRVGNGENFQNNPLCYYHRGAVPGGKYGMVAIKCNQPLVGRYVSVQKKGRGILSLCEIQVFQDIDLPPFTLAGETCLDQVDYCREQRTPDRGICNPKYSETWFRENCAYTCGYCERASLYRVPTLRPGDTSRTTANPRPNCKDDNESCFHWKGMGKCQRDRAVQSQCRRSCGLC